MATKKNGRLNVLPAPRLTIVVFDGDDELGRLPAFAKEFSTGSLGYHATGKIEVDADTRFQSNFQMILVGSKKK